MWLSLILMYEEQLLMNHSNHSEGSQQSLPALQMQPILSPRETLEMQLQSQERLYI